MSRIREVFGRSHVLLPVIHPIGRQEALASIEVARACGVPGVFLIDQGMHERELLAFVREVRQHLPGLWVGVNLLTRSPAEALARALDQASIDGIWSDDAGIDESGADHPRAHPRAQRLVDVAKEANWKGLYFGGVAFKYQREVAKADLSRAAALATAYMDVICTSGPGTGQPADIEKVRLLRAGLGDHHALAIASGITPENVRSYMPYTQAFLVGTGIEKQLGVLDPAKIEQLLWAMEHDV